MECRVVFLVALLLTSLSASKAVRTPWTGRSLKSIFDAVSSGCPQGPQETVTKETMLNHHDWWEQNWGRTDASWPRRGFPECWANRGTVCPLPNRDNVVCLPGSRRGSTISKGWALDPKGQACKPGVHCLYACEPGYYWTTFNQQETSNFDHANAHQKGHCDGTWNYGTSSHGVYCKEDGTLDLPKDKPLCSLGETYVYAENRLDTHVFLCQTVFPGHEIFLIPTLVKPGQSVMITTQPVNFWHGPTYSKPTHGDFYVSFAGADIMEACTWDEFSPSGASLLPYEIGSGVEDNGVVYSTHYFYQQPNSEVPVDYVGYVMDLECESTEPGVCGPVFRSNNVVKADVLKKPKREGSTKVKFIFRPPSQQTSFGSMYNEPSRNHLHDVTWITGMRPRGSSRARRTPKRPSSSTTVIVSSDNRDDGYHGSSPAEYHQSSQSSGYTEYSPGYRPDFAPESEHHYVHQGSSSSHSSAYSSHSGASHVGATSSSHSSGSHSSSYTHVSAGRKLKFEEKSTVYLHNTLDHPIALCGVDESSMTFVGPGEKLQLTPESSLTISTEAEGGDCSPETAHWHLSVGQSQGQEEQIYSYTQNESHTGYRLSIRCVSETDACNSRDGTSVSVPIGDKSHEVTFVAKPSRQPSVDAYAWGHAVHRRLTSMIKFSI